MDNEIVKDSHNYDHSHLHHKTKVTNNIKRAFYLNLTLAIIELIFSLFSNSMALMSNSFHDFGDSIILLFAYKIEGFSYRGRDNKFTYGYRRFSLIGSILNIVILMVGSVIIIFGAVNRIFHPEVINENIVIFFSIIGVLANFIAYKILNSKDLMSKTLSKNLLLDSINWLVIFFGSVIVSFTGFYFIDSILSLIVVGFMLVSVFGDLTEIFLKLMQAVPKDVELNEIDNVILSHDGIIDYHDLHIWDLDGNDYIASFHIVLDDNVNETEIMYIKESLKKKLEEYKINHTTIEIDTKTQAIFNNELKVDKD